VSPRRPESQLEQLAMDVHRSPALSESLPLLRGPQAKQ
jgi:hypothetical protein